MSWTDDVRRANDALDWIEARQGPLPESGYARIETDVRTVRAMAEGQDDDARLAQIRDWATRALAETSAADMPLAVAGDTVFLLARLDALAAEASDVVRENESLIEEVKASGEQIAALAAERDEINAAVREHHEAALEKLEGRVTHWMGQRDKFCDQLADEKKAHARTQEWLDKFQSEAATQQVRGIMAEQALAKAEAERDALRARAKRVENALLEILRESAWEARLTEWRKHSVTAVGTQPTPQEACREIRTIARAALANAIDRETAP